MTAPSKVDLPVLADAYDEQRVLETPGPARDFMAQVVCTELRRERHPERTTWSPLDQSEPDTAPRAVLDGDGARWVPAEAGTWRMPSFRPDRHEARAGELLTWQQLAYHYGPLTEAKR